MSVARTDLAWPLYFAAKPLKTAKTVIQKGEAFVIQAKDYIRGLGTAYGVTDAWTRPFGDLPYVRVLNVRSKQTASLITQQGLGYDQAAKLVEGTDA